MTVTLEYEAIEDFKDSWPCSGIPELDSITFEYDSAGNLVDIIAIADGQWIDSANFDGPALLALSMDAQQSAS